MIIIYLSDLKYYFLWKKHNGLYGPILLYKSREFPLLRQSNLVLFLLKCRTKTIHESLPLWSGCRLGTHYPNPGWGPPCQSHFLRTCVSQCLWLFLEQWPVASNFRSWGAVVMVVIVGWDWYLKAKIHYEKINQDFYILKSLTMF